MRGIYSGCALIKKRLAVRLYLREKILRPTQKMLWPEQISDIRCTVRASEVFFLVYSSPSPLSSYP